MTDLINQDDGAMFWDTPTSPRPRKHLVKWKKGDYGFSYGFGANGTVLLFTIASENKGYRMTSVLPGWTKKKWADPALTVLMDRASDLLMAWTKVIRGEA